VSYARASWARVRSAREAKNIRLGCSRCRPPVALERSHLDDVATLLPAASKPDITEVKVANETQSSAGVHLEPRSHWDHQADRDSTGELIQAKKSFHLEELSQHQGHSTLRQIEFRLPRLMADRLPPVQGMVYGYGVPESLPVLMGTASQSNEILQMEAQAQAATQYVRVLEASKKPQVGWTVGGQTAQGLGGTLGRSPSSTNLSVGINITIPLHNPGVDIAIESAQKRAQASQMQRDEALKNRLSRLEESFVQTQTLAERIQQIAAVLDNTQQLRNFTLQQWQQLGRRSLFDVKSAEGEHYNLQVQYVNGLHDEQQMRGVMAGLTTFEPH
jgi:outer membrane protein, adhesin transport system